MFHFKKFSLTDDRSTMKIGTDAVLLGIIAGKMQCQRVLEIGSGCGVISLLIAQQTDALIDAIDIDEQSCIEARENFLLSPWADRLNVMHDDIIAFASRTNNTYDLIVTNPPYFKNGTSKNNMRVGRARHEKTLSLKSLLQCVRKLLINNGNFICILPDIRIQECLYLCNLNHLFLNNIWLIHPKEGANPNRYIMTFSYQHFNSISFNRLIIRKSNLRYTDEYKNFVFDFYLDFPF